MPDCINQHHYSCDRFFFYIVMKARQDDTIVSIMVLFSSQLFCLMLALVAKIFSLLELAVCGWLQTGISAALVLKFSFDSRVLNKTSTWESISDMNIYRPKRNAPCMNRCLAMVTMMLASRCAISSNRSSWWRSEHMFFHSRSAERPQAHQYVLKYHRFKHKHIYDEHSRSTLSLTTDAISRRSVLLARWA